MSWITFVLNVIQQIASDPALKPLEQEFWAWLLGKIHALPATDPIPDPSKLVKEFKTSKGMAP